MNQINIFKNIIATQLRAHPSMLPQDVVKLCYQAANGAEHLLEDVDSAQHWFHEEFDAVPVTEEPLFEPISREIYRANLGAWKREGLPAQWLFRMFTGTALRPGGPERLQSFLTAAQHVLEQFGYPMDTWDDYLTDYKRRGMPPVHHSEAYRAAEHPAYRIVHGDYALLLPVLRRAAAAKTRPYVISIDGRAGAGKSTFAARLQQVLEAGVVYMDDFFLPSTLRTPQRLAEAGGNVHYERFGEEVLPALHRTEAFAYTRFDCSVMDYGPRRQVAESPWRIVEGSYSHHPALGDYADLRVFLDVDEETQLQRICARDGAVLAERFRREWIPMENHYFETFRIRQYADLVINESERQYESLP